MKYVSTRGVSEPVGFSDAVFQGLARDGGLLVPESFPDFSSHLEQWKTLSYSELALEIFHPFVGDELSKETLRNLIDKSYAVFENPEITPLVFHDNLTILELFHGPTLAFKDVALQFLGNLFEELLKKENRPLNILGATSGDTGSAAIHGVRGKKGISIFMLHPQGKVSPVQEKQMTTVLDKNVHNIAVDGTFDDCQSLVKAVFNDLEFRDKYGIGAVNSINWARIMAQIVYYFYAAFRFEEKLGDAPLYFSVPTGNFGDIYAGYLAKKMGLPIQKLILATNENNILERVLKTGDYSIGEVFSTLSPSMDIQISSNFERFIFDLVDCDGSKVRQKMENLAKQKRFSLTETELKKSQQFFQGICVKTDKMLETIRLAEVEGVVLDPHTAVGVAAAKEFTSDRVICLATAHPAKFPAAILQATGKSPEVLPSIRELMSKPSRSLKTKADITEIKRIIRENL